MTTEAARTACELQMLEGMVDCAHVLGQAFGAATKAETDLGRSLERFDAFQKCFLAVRMGIRLCMSLRAGRPVTTLLRPTVAERPEARERERAEHEAPERGDPVERERERDYEPVSLPTFLRTLGVVAREAARLGDQLPAEASRTLPALQSLLAQAQNGPSGVPTARLPLVGAAVLAQPAPPGRRRGSLLGSAAVASPGPCSPRPWSGFG